MNILNKHILFISSSTILCDLLKQKIENLLYAAFKTIVLDKLTQNYDCIVFEISNISEYNKRLIELLILIRYSNQNQITPIVLIDYYNKPENYSDFFYQNITNSPGINVIKEDFSLNNIVKKIDTTHPIEFDVLLNFKQYISNFIDTSLYESIYKHDLSNYLGAISLLEGALYLDIITKVEYNTSLKKYILPIIEKTNKNISLQAYFSLKYNLILENKKSNDTYVKIPDVYYNEDTIKTKIYENICIIDDHATNGWLDTLKKLFFQKEKLYVYKNIKDIKNLLKNYKKKVNMLPFKLILLDLRIEPEIDNKYTFMETPKISGYKILKEIRNIDISVPVIIFTASNKSYNLEELSELSIQGFYSKQLPNISPELAVDNFLKLNNLININSKNFYLREIWYNILVMLQFVDDRMAIVKAKNLYYLIKTTPTVIDKTKLSFQPYNDFIIKLHQVLEYILHKYGFEEYQVIKNLKKLSGIHKYFAILFNDIRNGIMHHNVREISLFEVLFGFTTILYILNDLDKKFEPKLQNIIEKIEEAVTQNISAIKKPIIESYNNNEYDVIIKDYFNNADDLQIKSPFIRRYSYFLRDAKDTIPNANDTEKSIVCLIILKIYDFV